MLWSAILVTALCAGCAQDKPVNGFSLKGTVEGMDGQYLYLSYQSDTLQVSDSTLVKDGRFEFKGILPVPAMSALLSKTQAAEDPATTYHFYIEPAEMTLSIDTANYANSHLKGSLTQAQVDSMYAARDAILDEAKSIREAVENESDPQKQSVLGEQLIPYYARMGDVVKEFIVTHPASVAAADNLLSMMATYSYEDLSNIYSSFTDDVKNSPSGKIIGKNLATLTAVQPGQPAPEFKTTDVNGNPLKLSDFRGKYVILDFWASWCAPCRQANPHMKELYGKYHNKGLEFIYIADNDSRQDQWREAIKKDKLEDFYHVLCALDETETDGTPANIKARYGVNFLPTKFLIDPEGKIVACFENDQTEKMDNTLADVFK